MRKGHSGKVWEGTGRCARPPAPPGTIQGQGSSQVRGAGEGPAPGTGLCGAALSGRSRVPGP